MRISQVSSNRSIISIGTISISEDRSSVELLPDRSVDLHLNVVKLLEGKACNDCLKIENFFVTSNDMLFCDVTLTHSYPGLTKFTGFDVRAVVITELNFHFSASDKKINWDGNLQLLYPDGYTTLFNPTDYPSDGEGFDALKYIPGKYSTGGDLSSTLNPFVSFKKDKERRIFETNVPETKLFRFQLTPGPIEFGYVVDAS